MAKEFHVSSNFEASAGFLETKQRKNYTYPKRDIQPCVLKQCMLIPKGNVKQMG